MENKVLLNGTTASFDGKKMTVKGPKGTVERPLWFPGVSIKVESDHVLLTSTAGERRRDKRILNTLTSHVKNMVTGTTLGYRYNLVLVQSHFPVQLKVEGNTFVIENYFGEKVPRKIDIPAGVKVTANTKEKKVTVESADIELAGMVVTRLEQATRAIGKDLRIFQDGLYLVNRENMEAGK